MLFLNSIKTILAPITLSVVLYLIINVFVDLSDYRNFFITCLSAFALFNLTIYSYGEITMRKNDANSFFGIITISFLLKIVMAIALIMAYKTNKDPSNNLFIIPFFICYLSFAIFETRTMLQQTNANQIK